MNVIKDRFRGRTILITGSTSGIGEAAALRAGAEGANVVVVGRNAERGASVAERVKASGGDALFLKCDLTDEKQTKEMFARAFEHYGDIQLFVNNAGVLSKPDRVIEYSTEEWSSVFAINVNAVFYCCREELRHMTDRGLTGAIVNTGSIAGLRGFTCACAYVASKHAVNGLTKAIALEYAHKGIRCNSVNPCGSGTPMNDRCNGDYMEKLKKVAADGGDPAAFADEWLGIGKLLSPMERNATAEEQAAAILFLLSDDASFITGSLLPVEGGWCVY
jgi:NAD(P)-dependent dehydrogenase (short-subunit alcohol dehydrogenase family)